MDFKRFLAPKIVGATLVAGIIAVGGYVLMSGKTELSTTLEGITGPKTLANYVDKFATEYEYQQVRYVAPKEVQDTFPIDVVARFQRYGETEDRVYFEVKLPDVTFNTENYGEFTIQSSVFRVISVARDQKPEATYISIAIPNIDQVLSVTGFKELIDMMATYPPYARLVNEVLNPILYKQAWLRITADELKEFSGEDSQSFSAVSVDPKDVKKALKYVAKGFVVEEEKKEGDTKKIVVRVDLQALKVGLERLRKDEELLKRLNIKVSEISKMIEDIDSMQEKDRKLVEALRIVLYLREQGGKYFAKKIGMYIKFDDDSAQRFADAMQEGIDKTADPKVKEVLEAFKQKAETDKRLDLGYIDVAYDKVEVELPGAEDVVEFQKIMEIAEMFNR